MGIAPDAMFCSIDCASDNNCESIRAFRFCVFEVRTEWIRTGTAAAPKISPTSLANTNPTAPPRMVNHRTCFPGNFKSSPTSLPEPTYRVNQCLDQEDRPDSFLIFLSSSSSKSSSTSLTPISPSRASKLVCSCCLSLLFLLENPKMNKRIDTDNSRGTTIREICKTSVDISIITILPLRKPR